MQGVREIERDIGLACPKVAGNDQQARGGREGELDRGDGNRLRLLWDDSNIISHILQNEKRKIRII